MRIGELAGKAGVNIQSIRFYERGILAATAAFFLLLAEVVVGLTLRETLPTTRRPLRRIHFWIMIVFAVALTIHLWLNSS